VLLACRSTADGGVELLALTAAEQKEERLPAASPSHASRALFAAARDGDLNAAKRVLGDHKAGGGEALDLDLADPERCGLTALGQAVVAGHAELVAELADRGASVTRHSSRHGDRPLHWACAAGHADVVKTLLERKGSVDDDAERWKLLHRACAGGHLAIVRMLTDGRDLRHANINFACELASARGHTELLVELEKARQVVLAGFR
jgi:hypothetical protein